MRGHPLHINYSVQARYEKRLKKLVALMTKETRKAIHALYNADHGKAWFGKDTAGMDASVSAQARMTMNKLTLTFDKLFASHANDLAQGMVNDNLSASKSALNSSLKQLSGGLSIKTDLLGKDLKQITTAAVAENVSLIKSIPSQYLDQVQGAVMRSITHGNGLEDLIPEIAKYDGITERRATNIALDQTRKVYNSINIERSKAVGVTKGEWIHSGGSQKPRETHLDMDGEIFDLEEGMYDPDVGENIMPGELPNCGCTYSPIIEFDDGEPSED